MLLVIGRAAAYDRRMQLRHLEQIVAIITAGGFNGAARVLGVSQPTLSKSIARLENELGVALFERAADGARATPHGTFIAKRAEPLLRDIAALEREIRQRARGEMGQLTIAVGSATIIKPLPQVLRQLAVRFPNLQTLIRRIDGTEAARGVHDGRHDIAFTMRENAEPFPDLIRVKVLESRVVLLARPDHPLAGRGLVTPDDIRSYAVAAPIESPRFMQWVSPLTEEERRRMLALITNDLALICEHCATTDTIARGPRMAFDAALAAGTLVELPFAEHWPYECWMLTTKGLWTLPLVREVADLARASL
ncbi:LysR family transcriptional regulator [Sphingomonas dokdonensis]|uniref:Hydrogen peroxide-inducible protein activator n=1 Tax=Sphingomonas dokdonensis TaxID=344880 RepID=A0A245ZTT7_9SPHN|nr:LysR family transcriptional regulator [Sphingomonas dokdonensis]OWK33151.1 hydrogen peroxide-inducible protein activator [Sphingomonas dokdonensis]